MQIKGSKGHAKDKARAGCRTQYSSAYSSEAPLVRRARRRQDKRLVVRINKGEASTY